MARTRKRRKARSEGHLWIKKAIKHHGTLHRELHVPKGKKIPLSKLKAAAKKRGKPGLRARLALTLRALHKK